MVSFSDVLAEDIGKWQWGRNGKNHSNEGVAGIDSSVILPSLSFEN